MRTTYHVTQIELSSLSCVLTAFFSIKKTLRFIYVFGFVINNAVIVSGKQ